MCRKLYFRFVFYAVRTDLRIMKKKGEKSSQSDWLSTSMSPAAYLCRRYSTDVCSRAFAALGRAHAVPCYGQDCLHLPTDDLPSCSPCDPIRPQAALHLCTVSMPYRHISPLPAETPHGMPVSSHHKKKAAPSVTELFPYDPSEATISGASARWSDQLTSSAAICPTAPGGNLTSGTGNCGGRWVSHLSKTAPSPDRRPSILFTVRSHPAADHSPSSRRIDAVPAPSSPPSFGEGAIPGQNERPSAHRAEGLFGVGIYLLSRAASSQVSSTRVSLTAVFGMGTGVPSPSSTPTICGYHRRYLPAHHGAIP